MSEQDFDQLLLQQFSCMGTTDKDELVKQLQAIVGHELNFINAQFFLEMNNWNLQGAVGSYFDSKAPFTLPSMVLLRSFSVVDDETRVHPGTRFFKTFDVQNPGTEPWPAGCYAAFAGGCLMSDYSRLPVLKLLPGCMTTLRIDMKAPDNPGVYQSKWRMSTSTGQFFGDVIWIIVTVCDQTLNGLTQQLSTLSSLGSQADQPRANSNPYSNATSHSLINDIVPMTMEEDANAPPNC